MTAGIAAGTLAQPLSGIAPAAATNRARRLRVLFLSPQPFFESRGTPLRVLQMVRTLCAAGHEVHLLSYPLGRDMVVPGLVHHRAPRVPGIRSVPVGFSLRKIVLDAVMAVSAWRRLLLERWDVVHCVEESIFFAQPVARWRGTRIIFDLNSSVAHQLEYGGTVRHPALVRTARALQARALRRSHLAITVGRSLTEEGVRSLGSDVPVAEVEDCAVDEVLRPPDPERVAALRRELRLENARIVVYTGNLASYQGVDLLLRALPILVSQCPTARLLLVGGDPHEVQRASTALDEYGLRPHVVFTGQQPPEHLPELMALADALVSPRTGGRNTPLKLYSYMHTGIPIVATDLPTHTQVLDRTTAVLCAPTPEALGESLAAVLLRPTAFARLGAAASARAIERYSEAAFTARLLGAYERLFDESFVN